MMNIRAIVASVMALLSSVAFAGPDVIHTPDADIVVIRPVDVWSGNESSMENSLDSVKNRLYAYTYITDEGKYIDNHNKLPFPASLFQNSTIDLTIKTANDKLKAADFTPATNTNKYFFITQKAVTIQPDELSNLVKVQDYLYKNMVIANGDPTTFESRLRWHKIGGNLLALATIGLSAGKLGADTGTKFALDSGLSNDMYQLGATMKTAIVPLPVDTNLDPKQYTSIDVRKVVFLPDTVGQIIIAYKVSKTDQVESEALGTAIAATAGFDTTPDDIIKARQADQAARQAIWNECVASGQCK